MPIIIQKTDRKDITKLVCPFCGDRLRGIVVFKDSRIDGLGVKCKRCLTDLEVKTE